MFSMYKEWEFQYDVFIYQLLVLCLRSNSFNSILTESDCFLSAYDLKRINEIVYSPPLEFSKDENKGLGHFFYTSFKKYGNQIFQVRKTNVSFSCLSCFALK